MKTAKQFTAAWCAEEADKIVATELAKTPNRKSYKCSCDDGYMTITTTTIDSKKGNKIKTSIIPCINCNCTGILTQKQYKIYLFQKAVACTCSDSDRSSVYASDGRDVFGNDTYLCVDCAMVCQFG